VNLSLRTNFGISKVAPVTALFWILKLLTTAMGEATSDHLVKTYNPVVVVLIAGVIFLATIVWQMNTPRYRALPYWLALVMVSIFGTMCADVLHVQFGVPYIASTAFYAVALCVVFVTWRRTEGTLSIHSITTTRRELFYWLTVTATFALGTAVGDLTAVTFHLGFFGSGVMFAVLFLLPALGFVALRLNAIACFWTSYVLTRPLGASFADWFGVSKVRGGLNYGTGKVSVILSIVIFLLVLLAAYQAPSGKRS